MWSPLLTVNGKVAFLVLVDRGDVINVAVNADVVTAAVVMGPHADCNVLDVIVSFAAFPLLCV